MEISTSLIAKIDIPRFVIGSKVVTSSGAMVKIIGATRPHFVTDKPYGADELHSRLTYYATGDAGHTAVLNCDLGGEENYRKNETDPTYWSIEVRGQHTGVFGIEDIKLEWSPSIIVSNSRAICFRRMDHRFWNIGLKDFESWVAEGSDVRLTLRTRNGQLVAAWKLTDCYFDNWDHDIDRTVSVVCHYQETTTIKVPQLLINDPVYLTLQCAGHFLSTNNPAEYYRDNGAFFVDWMRSRQPGW